MKLYKNRLMVSPIAMPKLNYYAVNRPLRACTSRSLVLNCALNFGLLGCIVDFVFTSRLLSRTFTTHSSGVMWWKDRKYGIFGGGLFSAHIEFHFWLGETS